MSPFLTLQDFGALITIFSLSIKAINQGKGVSLNPGGSGLKRRVILTTSDSSLAKREFVKKIGDSRKEKGNEEY